MMKESTYQRYKRENIQLKQIVDVDVRNFILDKNIDEFKKKKSYIIKFIKQYSHKK